MWSDLASAQSFKAQAEPDSASLPSTSLAPLGESGANTSSGGNPNDGFSTSDRAKSSDESCTVSMGPQYVSKFAAGCQRSPLISSASLSARTAATAAVARASTPAAAKSATTAARAAIELPCS